MDYRQTHLAKGDTYDATIAAQPYDAYAARIEAAYLRELLPALAVRNARYLDFACGTGRITETVSPFVAESVGVDISESMLAVAREKCPAVRFLCIDLTRETPDIGPFDLATSFRFFGNAQDELRTAALRSLAGLLRPGGHLIVNSHRNPNAIGSLLQARGGAPHGMDLTYGKLRRMLQEHGFRIVSARPVGLWLIRSRMRRNHALMDGRRAAAAERLFRHRFFAPWAPDCVIVAQKK